MSPRSDEPRVRGAHAAPEWFAPPKSSKPLDAPGSLDATSSLDAPGSLDALDSQTPASSYVKIGEHEYLSVTPDKSDSNMLVVRTRKRVRRKHREKKRASRGKKALAVALAALCCVVVGAFACAAFLVHTGEINLRGTFAGLAGMPESAQVDDTGEEIDYDGHRYRYNSDVVSVVLIGHDDETGYALREGASCADVVVLLAMNTQTNQLKAVVVPRNSVVDVDVYNSDDYVAARSMPIALSYAVDVSTQDACAANTTSSVARLFYGLPISYYFAIDEQAFVDATDAVGGVTLTAQASIPRARYAAGDTVTMNGEEAFAYIRYRDTGAFESALDRQQRQMQFISAFSQTVRGLGTEGLVRLYGVMERNVVTNLSISEIAYLASCYVAGNGLGASISSLKGSTQLEIDADGKERENYYLDEDSVMRCMLDAFYVQVA